MGPAANGAHWPNRHRMPCEAHEMAISGQAMPGAAWLLDPGAARTRRPMVGRVHAAIDRGLSPIVAVFVEKQQLTVSVSQEASIGQEPYRTRVTPTTISAAQPRLIAFQK